MEGDRVHACFVTCSMIPAWLIEEAGLLIANRHPQDRETKASRDMFVGGGRFLFVKWRIIEGIIFVSGFVGPSHLY